MKQRLSLALLWLPLLLIDGCSTGPAATDGPAAQKTTPDGPLRVQLDSAQAERARITLASVQRRALKRQVQTGGLVQTAANLTLAVSTPVDGRVEGVKVQLGEQVAAGQVLAVLKSDQISQIESDLLQQVLGLDADRKQALVQVSLTHSTSEREQRLFSLKVGARADLEVARSEYQKAQAALEGILDKRQALITATSERLRLLGVPVGEAERTLRTRRIENSVVVRAPRSGIITERNVNPGELTDNSKPLFAVADLSKVWLVAQVFEQDIPLVKTGQSAVVRVDSYPGRVFNGRVNFVSSALDPSTRTLAVRATIDNPERLLKPQMFARMALGAGSVEVISVPAGALQKSGETYVAYVPLGKNSFEERQVTVGRTLGNFVEVKGGLRSGEQVAVRGSLELQGQAQQLASQ